MAIVYTKERASWPSLMLAMLRFDNVEDDGNSVLIIVTDEALVCISGIGAHYAIPLITTLRRFVVRDYYACARS